MGELDPNARVEEIAATHSIAPRTLQRLFQRYVGVSPKWVLKRLRIHQTVERLGEPLAVPWTTLGLCLSRGDSFEICPERGQNRICFRSAASTESS